MPDEAKACGRLFSSVSAVDCRVCRPCFGQVLTGSSFLPGTRAEPPHVHVEREAYTAKFWLQPVRLAYSSGFKTQELNRLRRLVEENQSLLRRNWDEYFES